MKRKKVGVLLKCRSNQPSLPVFWRAMCEGERDGVCQTLYNKIGNDSLEVRADFRLMPYLKNLVARASHLRQSAPKSDNVSDFRELSLCVTKAICLRQMASRDRSDTFNFGAPQISLEGNREYADVQ